MFVSNQILYFRAKKTKCVQLIYFDEQCFQNKICFCAYGLRDFNIISFYVYFSVLRNIGNYK